MNSKDQKKQPIDPYGVRAEMVHQGIRGLLILNGGACIAVLGFLQALWRTPGEPHPLTPYLFWSLLLYALGVLLGSAVFIPRYFCSLRFEQHKKSAKPWAAFSWSLQIAPLASFLTGTIVFVVGGFCELSGLY